MHPMISGRGKYGPYLPMKNLLCSHVSMRYEWWEVPIIGRRGEADVLWSDYVDGQKNTQQMH